MSGWSIFSTSSSPHPYYSRAVLQPPVNRQPGLPPGGPVEHNLKNRIQFFYQKIEISRFSRFQFFFDSINLNQTTFIICHTNNSKLDNLSQY